MGNKYAKDNKKAELDIYIPSKKVAIEYDGTRFHQDAKKDNLKSRSACNNTLYVEKLIRIREIGCPKLEELNNLRVVEVIPFSLYHKDSVHSLEEVIKQICFFLELPVEEVIITEEVISYCNSEDFYKNEQKMIKQLFGI